MDLEQKIANWLNAGVMPCAEALQLQDRLVALRKQDIVPDTILAVQHPLEINCGKSTKDNKFSDMLKSSVRALRGSDEIAIIIEDLRARGIPVSYSDRGGGGTVFEPGQYIF